MIAGRNAQYGMMGWDAAQMQPTAASAATSGVGRALSRGRQARRADSLVRLPDGVALMRNTQVRLTIICEDSLTKCQWGQGRSVLRDCRKTLGCSRCGLPSATDTPSQRIRNMVVWLKVCRGDARNRNRLRRRYWGRRPMPAVLEPPISKNPRTWPKPPTRRSGHDPSPFQAVLA